MCLIDLASLQPLPHTANSVLLCYPGTRAGASNVSGDGKGKDVVGRKVPKEARERRRRVRLLADIHVFLGLILVFNSRATTDGVVGGEGADRAAVPPHRAVKTEAKSNSPFMAIFGCSLMKGPKYYLKGNFYEIWFQTEVGRDPSRHQRLEEISSTSPRRDLGRVLWSPVWWIEDRVKSRHISLLS